MSTGFWLYTVIGAIVVTCFSIWRYTSAKKKLAKRGGNQSQGRGSRKTGRNRR